MAEVFCGIDLAEPPYNETAELRENKQSMVTLLTLMNDLFSFNKEVDDEFKGNSIHQIQVETSCSSRTAMDLVHQMVLIEKGLFDQNFQVLEAYGQDAKASSNVQTV